MEFLVLKYHPTDRTQLKSWITNTYKQYSMVHGIKLGGDMKLLQFQTPKLPFKVCNNDVLQKVVQDLHESCHRSYQGVDFDMMEVWYGISDPEVEEKNQAGVPAKEPEDQKIIRPRRPPTLRNPSMSTSTNRDNAPRPSSPTIKTGPESGTAQISTVSVPGELKDFLSCHWDLYEVFLSYDDFKAINDKHVNQFVIRAHQTPIDPPPRARSSNIGTMSMTTGSDLMPELGRDVRSSPVVLSFTTDVSVGKRHREEDHGSEVKDANSGDGSELAQSIAKRIKTGEASSSGASVFPQISETSERLHVRALLISRLDLVRLAVSPGCYNL